MARSPKYVPVYFAPDKDPSWNVNPGVLTDVRNLVPTVRGTLANYCSTPDETYTSVAAYASALVPNTAKIMRRVGLATGSGSARFFIGTDTDLLEAAPTAISNVSKSAAAYSASEWAFDAFGDSMLAAARSGAQPTQPVQRSTGPAGTAFADLTNSPRASIVVVQRGFVLAYDCYDGTNWYNDGWMCSGQNNPTSWCADFTAPANVATQANYGRVYETAGGWTAAYRMRDGVAAYKGDSIYLARYTGPITASAPNTWSHTLVSDRVGVANHNAIATVNGVHYFIHRTGVYRFDGSYPQNIGSGRVNNWLAERVARSVAYDFPGFRACVDEGRGLIFWYFRDSAMGVGTLQMTAALVYNYITDTFGWIDRPWDETLHTDLYMCCPVQASKTDLRSWTASTDGGRQRDMFTIGSIAGSITVRGVNVGNSARSTNTTVSLSTGDLGDDIVMTRVDAVKPRMLFGDDGNTNDATCNVDVKDSQGDYYEQSGLQIQAVATSTAAGEYRVTFQPLGLVPRVLLASDYLAFDANMLQGALGTPLGIRVTYNDLSNVVYPATLTTIGKWAAQTISLAAVAGKSITVLGLYFGTAAVTGLHQALVRNVRISDSAGLVRQWLYDGNDRIYFPVMQVATNYTVPFPVLQDVRSLGRPFTYDARRRRFQGNTTGRLARVRMTLNNKTDIGGLWIDANGQEGTE